MAQPRKELPPEAIALLGVVPDTEIAARFKDTRGAVIHYHTVRRIRQEKGIAVCPLSGGDIKAQNRAEAAGEPTRLPVPYQGPTPTSDEDWGAFVESVLDHQDEDARLITEETHIKHAFGSEVIGIIAAGDDHFGGMRVDTRGRIAQYKEIGEYRRAYPGALHPVHLGDLTDSYLPNMGRASGGMTEEVVTSLDKQEGGGQWTMKQAGDWLLVERGCHEAWQLTITDRIAQRAKALNAHNGGFGAVLECGVGDFTYSLNLRHRWKRESSLNTMNAQRSMDDDFPMPDRTRADVICLGHLHFSDLQVRPKAGGRVVFARVGAAKVEDAYTKQGGWILGGPQATADQGLPLFILLPHRHRVVTFQPQEWRAGLRMLAELRKDHTWADRSIDTAIERDKRTKERVAKSAA